MAQPKKQRSPNRQGKHRSHLVLKLARRVNAKSPVKVRTTVRESGRKTVAAKETPAKASASRATSSKKKAA